MNELIDALMNEAEENNYEVEKVVYDNYTVLAYRFKGELLASMPLIVDSGYYIDRIPALSNTVYSIGFYHLHDRIGVVL